MIAKDSRELATDIVRRLTNEGYIAYFAGGWVRDFLMGHPSDDIDIATDASPEKILELFPRTLLIGISFGVVIVLVDGHQFEVATFRKDIEYEDGRKPKQIELSTAEEDAKRRDFTINGMFYDPLEGVVHDFVHGAEDIKHGVIRAIGDPDMRFVEDRLRMIRAVRFAARFGFVIDPETNDAIIASADTLFPAVAMERIWQEIGKMAKYPGVGHAFIEMQRLGLMPVIFPELNGLHLHEIKSRVACFEAFPKKVEPILYLLQLFPKSTVEEAEELCRYLRASNSDASLARFFVSMRNSVESEHALGIVDLCAWVDFYANPSAGKCLDVLAAHMPVNQREEFHNIHQQRADLLKSHIQRVMDKTPLVNAATLIANGVLPGKLMGVLIKEGQRYAVLNNVNSKEAVLDYLKTSHMWPKE